MFISLWVHGKAGDTDTPCGEVDVFELSGEKIHSSVLNKLLDYEANGERMDWFGDLPTERALLVEAKDISDEDGINLEVVGYFEDQEFNNQLADNSEEGEK